MSLLHDRLASSAGGNSGRRSTWRYALACALLFLACVVIARPWTAMPIVDDWSYVHIAGILARTGHIVYDGWVTPMLGWQLYAAALLFKVFGISLTVARMSTLAVAVATAFLLQRMLIRCGVAEAKAALGTVVLLLSPIYMQLSVTYMSDVQGVWALVLCLYCCLRAVESRVDRTAAAWISAAAVGNVFFGSCRQIAWLGVLVMVPSALWLLRRRRQVLRIGVAVTALSYALVFAGLRWFAHKPFSQSEAVRFHWRVMPFGRMGLTLLDAVLECLFLLLPLLLAFLPSWRSRRFWALLAAVAVLVTGAAVVSEHRHWDFLLGPYLQNWYSRFGHMNMEWPLFQPPALVLTLPWIVALNTLFFAGLAALAMRLRSNRIPAARETVEPETALAWSELLVLTVPYLTAYMVLLVPRSADALADRYCLPLAVVAATLVLRLWQQAEPGTGSALPWAVAAAIALFSIGATHDLFAYYRAKNAVVDEMLAAGVPRTAIDAGWDFDGETELEHAAYINNERILNPPGVYHPHTLPDADNCFFPAFADLFPHVDPVYGVRLNAQECYGPAPFAPVAYRRWLGLGHEGIFYAVRYRPSAPASAASPR